jgi:hypothetical protein
VRGAAGGERRGAGDEEGLALVVAVLIHARERFVIPLRA